MTLLYRIADFTFRISIYLIIASALGVIISSVIAAGFGVLDFG